MLDTLVPVPGRQFADVVPVPADSSSGRWATLRVGCRVLSIPGAFLPITSGRSSVYRALIRHGLIVPGKRKRRRADYRRWERGRAMELWQMDVMGRVHLADGLEVKVVTGIDDHSRFIVCAQVVVRATARPVCQALAAALGRSGSTEIICVQPSSPTRP